MSVLKGKAAPHLADAILNVFVLVDISDTHSFYPFCDRSKASRCVKFVRKRHAIYLAKSAAKFYNYMLLYKTKRNTDFWQ